MKNVRLWFEKTGSVKYISHLDLTRCMSRGLKLSGLPVWYTEGFNPRIYMTFAMPLSLGVSGERECMDIRLTEEVPLESIPERLNPFLPLDLRILEAAEPVNKPEAVEYAEYELLLETEDSALLLEKLTAMLARESVTVMKHGKKGDKELDIKPFFARMECSCPAKEVLKLAFKLPCSVAGSVNPSLLLDAMKSYAGEEPHARITRKRLLTKDFSEIR